MRRYKVKIIKISLFVLAALLLTACGEGKYEGMSNSELKEKKKHCDSIPKKSAVFANGCDKITKEVKRRRAERRKK